MNDLKPTGKVGTGLATSAASIPILAILEEIGVNVEAVLLTIGEFQVTVALVAIAASYFVGAWLKTDEPAPEDLVIETGEGDGATTVKGVE